MSLCELLPPQNKTGDTGASPGPCRCSGACLAPRHTAALRPESAPTPRPASLPLPPVLRETLSAPGHPLDEATRLFFEARFRHDFGAVRIHHDDRAARSAQAIGAQAFTVGDGIAFAAGRYRPGTREGRGLLAHELTHVVQQKASRPALDRLSIGPGADSPQEREADRNRRQIEAGATRAEVRQRSGATLALLPGSPAGGCGVCYGSPKMVGVAAHAEISRVFKATNPTVLAPFPLAPSPGDDNGILDLAVLRGLNTVDIGEIKPANAAGLLQGERDLLWYGQQLKLLGFRVNRMILPPPLAAIPFPTLAPPPCPSVQSLFVDPPVRGVYTYWCMPDFAELIGKCGCKQQPPVPPPVKVREKADERAKARNRQRAPERSPTPVPVPVPVRDLALLTVLLGGLALLAKTAGKRLLGPATAIAAIVLLADGAEASIGLGGPDALEALFKNSAARGHEIPEDIKNSLRNDPELRRLLEDAARSGKYDAAQQKAGENFTRTIRANRESFSSDELALLLKAGEGALPKGDLTLAEIRQQIELRKRGAGGGTGRPGTGAAPPEKRGQPQEPAPAAKAPGAPADQAERLVAGMATHDPAAPKFTPALRARLLAIARGSSPPLTGAEVTRLLGLLGSAAGKTEAEVAASLERGIRSIRQRKESPGAAEGQEAAGKARKPHEAPGEASVEIAVRKTAKGKPDPKLAARLEAKLGGAVRGMTYLAAAVDLVFEDGKRFQALVYGRDGAGELFFGTGWVTPHLEANEWVLEVPAGIRLKGASGTYGSTNHFRVRAFAGVGQGRGGNP